MESESEQSPANKLLSEFASATGSAVMLLNSDIDDACWVSVTKWLQLIGRQERLSLFLTSDGGSIEDAFWIVTAIREQCDSVDVLVPDRAKSAATLIALAADRIIFGRFGELGPLDPQVPDTAGGFGRRSPLEIVKALEYLRTYYLETFDIAMSLLLRRTGMDVAHALEHGIQLLSPIAEPLYNWVNYRELGEAVRGLAVGENYAKAVMRKWSPISEDSIDDIVRQLVWEYPEHGYIIDMEEARRIGLGNVGRLDEDSERLYFDSMRNVDQWVEAVPFLNGDESDEETEKGESTGGNNGQQCEAQSQ